MQKLSFEKFAYKPAIEILIDPKEVNDPMKLVDGKWALNLNSDKVRLYEVSAKKELYADEESS